MFGEKKGIRQREKKGAKKREDEACGNGRAVESVEN
jgi:hypothetical protein